MLALHFNLFDEVVYLHGEWMEVRSSHKQSVEMHVWRHCYAHCTHRVAHLGEKGMMKSGLKISGRVQMKTDRNNDG